MQIYPTSCSMQPHFSALRDVEEHLSVSMQSRFSAIPAEVEEHFRNNNPKDTRIPVKRIAVQRAHTNLISLLKQTNIRYVKKTFGLQILRVCCRTIPQLDNITELIHNITHQNLVDEIGMPLTYAYKMKSLVLFIKPKDGFASTKIEYIIKQNAFNFHVIPIDSPHPSKKHALVKKEITSIIANNSIKSFSKSLSSASEEEIMVLAKNNIPIPIGLIKNTDDTNIIYLKVRKGRTEKLWYNFTVVATLISFLLLISEFSRV